MHTVGTRLWRQKGKTWKIRHKHCMTWNISRKLTKKKNQKLPWYDVEYGEKQ